jgi:hypothetical protein
MALNLATKTSHIVSSRPSINKLQRFSVNSVFLARRNWNDAIKVDHSEAAVPFPSGINANEALSLARLPTSNILRNLFLGSFFASPLLFKFGFTILQRVATSRSIILNPDKNPLLRAIVKPLIYDQFCAGKDKQEVTETIARIKSIGFSGVILCSGKEIELRDPKNFNFHILIMRAKIVTRSWICGRRRISKPWP